jgi:hypothetical protein
MPEGVSLAEIVSAWPDPLPEAWDEFGVVCVNGEPIHDRAWWPLVRPRSNGPIPVVVTLVMTVPQNGAGKKVKNIAAIVGSIALIAATAWIGAGGLSAFGVSGLMGKLLGAGIGILGKLALNALAPPPPKAQGQQTQKTIQAGAQINILSPGAQLPTVLGRMRVTPPGLIRPYTTLKNGSLYTGFIVGLAGRHAVSSIQINNTDISQIKSAKYQVREGAPGDAKLTLCASTIIETGIQQQASTFDIIDSSGRIGPIGTSWESFPDWQSFKTSGTPQEFRIRFYWPAGLYRTRDDGTRVWTNQWIRVRMRRVGTSTWTNLPTACVDGESTREFRKEVRLIWTTKLGAVASAIRNAKGFRGNAIKGVAEYSDDGSVPTPRAFGDPGYRAATYFQSSLEAQPGYGAKTGYLPKYTRADNDSLKIYLNPAVFPRDSYEVQVKFGFPADFDGDVKDETPSRSFSASGSPLRVTDYATDFSSLCIIESASTLRSDYPLGFKGGNTLLAIQTRDTQVSSVSAIFHKKCPVYSGGDWSTIATSDNPADMLRHILLDALNQEPVPSALIDNSSIVAFRTWCAGQGLTCNAIIDGATVEQAMMIAAAAGHAAVRRSDTYSVIIEKDRSNDAIVQVFTPRNTRNNAIQREYVDPVHALRATYYDESDEWREKEVLVPDDGRTPETSTQIEAVVYAGKTNVAEVRRRAKLDLRQMRLRPRRYSFDTDSQFMVCSRGDLVSYTFDVVDRSSDAAWITAVTRNASGQVVGLALDASVFQSQTGGVWAPSSIFAASNVFAATAAPGVVIRRNNGTVVSVRVLESSLTNTVTLVTPQTIPDADLIGALAVAGVFGSETRRCIVWDIQPAQDNTASITLVDEAPGIPT